MNMLNLKSGCFASDDFPDFNWGVFSQAFQIHSWITGSVDSPWMFFWVVVSNTLFHAHIFGGRIPVRLLYVFI